jgi:hypothetical protein
MIDLFSPPILTAMFVGICYLWARSVRRGKPVTQLQRAMILYATVFVFGAAYVILFQNRIAAFIHWENAWIAALMVWGAFLALIAWRRYRSGDVQNVPSAN